MEADEAGLQLTANGWRSSAKRFAARHEEPRSLAGFICLNNDQILFPGAGSSASSMGSSSGVSIAELPCPWL